MIVCTYCGKENVDGSRFCEACGKPLINTHAAMNHNYEYNIDNRGFAGIVRYAGFWLRVVASLIDSLILALPLYLWTEYVGDQYIFPTILPWLYYAYLESSPKQATLGKQIIGIKVTDMFGKRVSFLRATARYFAMYLSFFTFCIGYIMVAFTKKKQGLHDIIAGCLVVKK